MGFHETFQQVASVLENIGSIVEEENYDGLIVKRLEASNTLDKGRTTKQSHIAITGSQMDMFPYVRADGYFEVEYDKEDADLKKYFVAQIPVYLHKENVSYLDSDVELFSETEKLVHISIVRSRRNGAADQIQMSMTYMDTPTYVDYRRIVHAGSYMVLLKRKSEMLYDMFSVKAEDAELEDVSLAASNNCFEKLATNTVVHLDELLRIDKDTEDLEERNKRLFKYWMGLQVKPEGDSDAGEPYSESTISQYVADINRTELPSQPGKTVFYTTSVGDVEIIIETLSNSPDKYAPQITAVRKYLEYLKSEEDTENYEDILNHCMWGIHIKKKNNALSEENPHVCIGWSAMGDLTGVETDTDITKLYEQAYPDNTNNRSKGQDVGQIRRFIKEVNIGDYIIFAESDVFHIGRVESEYFYDTSENPDQNPDYVNNRRVTWLKKNVSRKILSKQMHKSLATSMSIFGISDYRAAVVDILRGTYRKDDDIVEADENYDELKFVSGFKSNFKRNRILFGAPGTGKSFKLNKECKALLGEGNETDYERVTFHPDYSYANFVGTYKPVMVKNESTWEADEDKKEVIAILKDKSKSAQEKYDLLYDRFKADSLTRLPVLLGLYCDDNFKTRKQDGTDAVGDNSVERNHGRAIRPYVNLDAESTGKKEIAYEYVPGPFMRVLVKALKSCMDGSNKPYVLVVEEINRANVAAVFGDVFQLLDRDGDNISEYPIATTNDMRTYLAEQLGVDESAVETIKIPDNMFIWATMNSADQGVFPMDTAFKRRWDFTYLGIDDAVKEFSEKIVNRKYVLGKKSFARLVTWNDLRTAINETLSSDTFNINEDKLLGPYFIAKSVLESDVDSDFTDVFKNKVLMYLFDDAVKHKKKTFFIECKDDEKGVRYSDICKLFDVKGVFIFPTEISKRFSDKPDEEKSEADN